jgi:hypothetical protein
MRAFEHEVDGHTYWHTPDGWVGAPTHTDGTPDMEAASHVADYREHMAPDDYAALTAWLDGRPKTSTIVVARIPPCQHEDDK